MFNEYNVVKYTPMEYEDPKLGDRNLYTTLVCGHLHTVLLHLQTDFYNRVYHIQIPKYCFVKSVHLHGKSNVQTAN